MPDSALDAIDLGWELLAEGKEEEALNLLRETEKRGGITPEESLRCDILKAFLLGYLGKFEEAFILGEQAYQKSTILQKPLLSVDAIVAKFGPSLQIDRKGEIKEFIENIEKILKSVLQEPHSEVEQREALLYFIRGWYLSVNGKLDLGIKDFEKAITICERHILLSFLIPRILGNLGFTYLMKGELKKSLETSKKCLKLLKGSSVIIKIIELWSLRNIGEAYYQQGNLDLAIDYYEKSMTIMEQENLYNYINTYDSLIQAFLEKGSPKRANECLYLFQLNLEKSKNMEDVSYYKLSQARILKSSTRTRDRAKAESILRDLIEGEKVSNYGIHEEFFPGLILLCELYFEELKLTNDITIIEDIQPLVERIIKAAILWNSFSVHVHALLLQGVINLLQMNMEDARRYLTQAQKIANENGLQRLAKAISYEHDKMLEQINKLENLGNAGAPVSEILDLASIDDIIDGMQGKRLIKAPEVPSEKSVLLLIIAEGGVLIFSYPFTKEWKSDDTLFSSFLSAFNSFSDEFFSEDFDRAKFGQYTVLLEPIANFSVCYLFKGQTYLASQKLAKFSREIQNNISIYQTLEKFYNTNQVLELKDNPWLESLVTEIFTN